MSPDKGSADHSAPLLQQTLRGEIEPARALLLSGRASPGTACALRAVCALAHTPGIRAPTFEEVQRAGQATDSDRRAAADACVYQELAAFLAFDSETVRVWLQVHRAMVSSDHDGLAARLGQNWIDILEGASAQANSSATEAERDASLADEAGFVLTAAVQNGLSRLSLGDVEGATQVARRAARMARTESLLFHEYTANLLLARVRRHGGKPHFATRIVSALAQVLPPAWQRWASWEAFLAGGSAAEPFDQALRYCVDAIERGDRDRFDDIRGRLLNDACGWRDVASEARIWFAALDPAAPIGHSLERWARGVDEAMPYAVRSGTTAGGTVAYVFRPPGGTARRFLSPGIGLVGPSAAIDAGPGHDGATRTLSAVAALLLAGDDPIADATLFRQVYGFGFVASKHDGVFRTLLHRVRAVLAEHGPVERAGGTVSFRSATSILCPDPRCDISLEERVLQRIAASQEGLTATAGAQELRIPTKRVHTTLRGLVDEGACVSERDGRRLYFRVEDTTFNEPSMHRLGRLGRGHD